MKLLELGQLFAIPLQAAVKAQSLASQETISFIEQFGLEQGIVKNLRFKAERVVEEKIEPFEVNIPMLAVMPPPSMQLQEMNVEFAVEIVEPRTEPIKTAVLSPAARGSSLSSSLSLFSSLSQSSSPTMKVNMKLVKEAPEGLARLGDMLTDLLSGQATREQTPPPKTAAPIETVLGIGKETGSVLRAKGIRTAQDFVNTTNTHAEVKSLAKSVGVPEKRIMDWREKAELLIEK